ncbi:hypothetical protein [Nibribacter koreensis]|uniref:Uncharacterized protein n=1 Tax=Nibribacter koreensis TaxID=1084519 RepID=A0ABP8F5S4_9BACT
MNRIFTKDEINSVLGKESFWNPTRLVNTVGYVYGIPAFDTLLDGKLFTEAGALINIMQRPNGLQIEMARNLKWHSVPLLTSNITEISLEDKEQIKVQKEKSVIGRSIVGGLLLGPVGAVVGGMSGIGTKEVKGEMPDLMISIKHNSNGPEEVIVFSCKYKDRKEVEKFFKAQSAFVKTPATT